MPGPIAVALAALSGALYGLALAPGVSPVLAWVALVPLLVASARVGVAMGAVCGLLFAAVATGAVASWFPEMLRGFFGLSPAGSLLGWLAAALLVNGPPYALLCGWIAWRARVATVAPVLVGAAWLTAEWLRVHGPLPSPYAPLATSQLGTPLAQAADAIGAFGVGAVVVVGSAGLAALVVPALRGARPARDLAIAAGLVIGALAYGGWRGSLDHPHGEPLRVALVQPAPVPGARATDAGGGSLDQLLALSERARAREAGLVFWPESAVTFYLREPGPDRERVLELSRSLRGGLVLPGPHYRYAEPAPDYYSSVFLLQNGRVTGRYDKSALVPFAEIAPFGGWPRPVTDYRPGLEGRLLRADGAAIGAFLCAEVLFPEIARALATAGASVLANPSNDGWFGAEAPARLQLGAAALRAIENRRPLVRATTGGFSAVIDAQGRILAAGDRTRADLIEATIHPSTVRTPFQRVGFALPVLAAALVVAASLPRPRHRQLGGNPS